MQALEGIRVALTAIRAHKLRSFLVMLGNVIAVASIIAVVAIVDGANEYMQEQVLQQGSGIVELQRVDEMKILTDLNAFLETIYNPPLTLADREYLLDRLPSAQLVGARSGSRAHVARAEERLKNVPIRGYTSEYPLTQDLPIADGRHFSQLEVSRSRPVAVIGELVARDLFPGADPLGRKIKVRGRPFKVVGVIEHRGRILGEDQDTFVAIPITSFEKLFGRLGRARSLTIIAKAVDMERVPQLIDEIRAAMRQRHRLRPGDEDDFAVTTREALIGLWGTIKNILLSVLLMVVGISAVVAGIVIMNIMLVSVQERTREIGIRKAIGARRKDILWQFLVEALVLSVTGGLIGILTGYWIASIISQLTPLPYAAKLWAVIFGLLLASTIGTFFGIWPARRASRLDPVEALRYE